MNILLLLGPALFVVMAFILSFITPDYSLVHNTISELALHQNHLWQTANFLVSGTLIAGLGIQLWRLKSGRPKGVQFAAVSIAVLGIVLVLSGIFQTDPVTTVQPTLTGTIHNLVFLVGMLGMIAAQLTVGFKNLRSRFGVYSILSAIVSFVALVGVIGSHTAPGIPQRILVVLVMVWVTLIARRVLP